MRDPNKFDTAGGSVSISAGRDGDPIIVGISGASGVIYGIRLLQHLQVTPVTTHLVMSKSAELTMYYETDVKPADVKKLATQVHTISDVAASISSGSYRTRGMLILPCSVRTMSEIACGITSTLLTRAADVVLKEKRQLVLGVRETPLHVGHLETLVKLARMGAVVAPIVPAFYSKPKTLNEMIDHTVGRLLDHFDIDIGTVRRWKEENTIGLSEVKT